LNGVETITGGNMNMPIESSTLAMTRSITRNGRNSRKPIWNEVFSSLVTKAGTTTRSGSSLVARAPCQPRASDQSSTTSSRRRHAAPGSLPRNV